MALRKTARDHSIEILNGYLQNEISAVNTYELALKALAALGPPALLDECRRSHLERVAILREHILTLGGAVSTTEPGAWEVIAQETRVGIAALEEFEYQDLKRYREELAKLDEGARLVMRTKVLPAHEHTYRTIKNIRHTIG